MSFCLDLSTRGMILSRHSGLFSLKFIYSRSYSLFCLLLHQRVRQERQISTKLCPSLCHYFFLLNKYNLLQAAVVQQSSRTTFQTTTCTSGTTSPQANRASTPSKSTNPNFILLARKKIVIFQIWE